MLVVALHSATEGERKKSHVLEKIGEKEFHILVIAFIIIGVSVIHFPLLSVRQTTENIIMAISV